jgi:biotin carboxyl carrier protein
MKRLVNIGGVTLKTEDLEALNLDCLEVEPGVYSVLMGARSVEVRVWQNPAGVSVELMGVTLDAEVLDPRETGPRRAGIGPHGRQSITSPMPGKVVRVLVEKGAMVEAGQGLVVVEAMKMQNEMKAPKAGKVVALPARAGANVNAGEVLVTLE